MVLRVASSLVMHRVLMLGQWLLGVAIALLLGPSIAHPLVLTAVFLGGAMCVAACLRDTRETREIAARAAENEELSARLRERIDERNAELAKAQKHIAESERLSSVGTLAAGVAHEINNPLAFILGNVDFAVRELLSPTPELDEVRIALDEARIGGTRVRDIVRDLKLFARAPGIENGSSDVETLLERSISMAANEIRYRAKLVRNYRGVPHALGSETRLGQVFLNLLINAAQAIPEGNVDGNEIRVSTRVDGEWVEVEVADTGKGIPAEVRARIFEPFYTTKPVGVGTGLGLSICHGIVHSVGGNITVDSAPGKGTSFRVRLPIAVTAVRAAEPEAPEPVPPSARDILIVDNEPLLARALRRVLAPHRVIAETSGQKALLRLAAGERFDLVLCDMMMPEMSGPDVFAEIRRIAPDQADRVVFVTGGAFTDSARDFLASTTQRALEKPADADAIRAILDALPPLSIATRRRPTLTSLSGMR